MVKCYIPKNINLGLFIIRLTIGILFIYEGLRKFGLFGGPGLTGFSHIVWGSVAIAAFVAIVELIGGLMVILGFMTRHASIFLSIIFIVAILKVHFLMDYASGDFTNTLTRLAMLGSTLALVFIGSGEDAIQKD